MTDRFLDLEQLVHRFTDRYFNGTGGDEGLEEILTKQNRFLIELQVIVETMAAFDNRMTNELAERAARKDPGALRDRLQDIADQLRMNRDLLRNIARRIEEVIEQMVQSSGESLDGIGCFIIAWDLKTDATVLGGNISYNDVGTALQRLLRKMPAQD
jgi:hypothetical protein